MTYLLHMILSIVSKIFFYSKTLRKCTESDVLSRKFFRIFYKLLFFKTPLNNFFLQQNHVLTQKWKHLDLVLNYSVLPIKRSKPVHFHYCSVIDCKTQSSFVAYFNFNLLLDHIFSICKKLINLIIPTFYWDEHKKKASAPKSK